MRRNQEKEVSTFHLLRNSEDSLPPRFRDFKDGNSFCDVTLVGEDGTSFRAHKVILAGQSERLQTILTQFEAGPFCLYLAGVSGRELGAILDFIYSGEARVSQGSLGKLLWAANTLQVRGLMEQHGEVSHSQPSVVKEEMEIIARSHSDDQTVNNTAEQSRDQQQEDLTDPGSSGQYLEFVETEEQIDRDDDEEDEEDGMDPMKEKDPEKVQFSFLKTG